jgi:cobaltochelatase CobT
MKHNAIQKSHTAHKKLFAAYNNQPIAFMSYVHFDDEHEGGLISDLRGRLSGEVRMQTGKDFPIFQDRNDIQWGDNWRKRIEETLDSVTFLIPIITPSFFNSKICRDELKEFIKRERRLKRSKLILPIYYISSTLLDDASNRSGDRLAQELYKRQYADWRDLRFEPLSSPQARKAIAGLANQIKAALHRVAGL